MPALAARLEERDYSVDIYEMYASVDRLKGQPERQDDDKRIFAAAAAIGVKHG